MSMTFTKDLPNKKINVVRSFAAPVEKVWSAWTLPALLDQWWAPSPWKTVTKTMNFTEGGHWHYSMNGPEGDQHWGWVDYLTIIKNTQFIANDAFCDEHGTKNTEFPGASWDVSFASNGTATEVKMVITFESEEALKATVDMGFEEGFKAALGNLEKLLS
jgi:uncharacterized protein YndB with AHSA1/START domain